MSNNSSSEMEMSESTESALIESMEMQILLCTTKSKNYMKQLTS